ncbi:MAG: hypoxanthine phosphoribosyltransferase [Phycisphaerae bacterium]|nr:hypoxanthine phosphoribosyltransferase [Phycisphaerae bacterium]|tara:strand:- start:1018 stop:1566 length:549 start_codon:yes stop_codon:yes gene_type:complete
MHDDLETILIDRDSIAERIEVLAGALERDLRSRVEDQDLIVLPIMTGSVVFMADLMRHLPIPFRIEPVRAISYVGETTVATQPVEVEGFHPESIEGSHVLIVDDVLDSGRTIACLRKMAEEAGAASVMVCVLLRKETAPDVPCEYIGFDIPDEFVVGYGLDYNGLYRNLPDIAVLSPDVYRS